MNENPAFDVAREGLEDRLKILTDAAHKIHDDMLCEIGFARGTYRNHCFRCEDTFEAAKGSIICEPCGNKVIGDLKRSKG